MSLQLGSHVNQQDPIGAAGLLDAQCVQFFLGDPQSWRAPTVGWPGGAEELADLAEQAGVGLVVHAPYVINVASTNNRIRIPSRKLLQQTLTLAAQIRARGVIVHGGHVSAGDDPAVGFDNWRKAVDGLKIEVPLLIENTAGGQNAMTRHLESIERLWAAIAVSPNIDMVGFCLDTCHAHAARLELVGLADAVRAITGRIDVVHANDSRDGFGSGADRHANLGQGQVDPAGLLDVIRTGNCLVIVETPGGIPEQAQDLAWIRERCA